MRTSIGVRVVFAVGLIGVAVALPRAETRTSSAMNAKEKANLQHVRNWWLVPRRPQPRRDGEVSSRQLHSTQHQLSDRPRRFREDLWRDSRTTS